MKQLALFALTLILPLFLVALTISGSAYAGPAGEGDLDGKAIFTAAKCNMCHGVPPAGIEAKMSGKMAGPDLVDLDRDAALLTDYLRGDAEIDGKTHKKKFTGSDEELGALTAWLLDQQSE